MEAEGRIGLAAALAFAVLYLFSSLVVVGHSRRVRMDGRLPQFGRMKWSG